MPHERNSLLSVMIAMQFTKIWRLPHMPGRYTFVP